MTGLAISDQHRRAARAVRRPYGFTTASCELQPEFTASRPLQAMVVVYAAVWVWSLVDSVLRGSWVLENLMTVATLAALVGTYRRFPFSDLSYLMILIF